MSDTIDELGLQTKSLNTVISELTAGFQEIFGTDINVEQNSPDGQLINILAQAGIDIRELITSANNSFNPDRASGRTLDERVVINNIERKGGTYTIQPIEITVDRAVSLQGLDADYDNPDGYGYTVQDDAGNQFILIDSAVLTTGTTELSFRAKDIGLVETTIGTIVNPVTIVLGVTAVNNTSGVLEAGQNEETDAELRTRRLYSVSNPSSGYLNGLRGALLNIEGVSEARVYENFTNATAANGIPAHSIWVIAEGGANTDIANVIYEKKSFGCGMLGDEEIEINTDSGDVFVAKFDRPAAKNLYIRFDIQTTVTGTDFDLDEIKAYITENLSYNIGDFAETSAVTAVARDAIVAGGNGGVPVNVEVSSNGTDWEDFIEVDTLNEQWTVDETRITITEL